MVADWQTFYLLGGGAAAALAGLIFVAISLHERSIMGSQVHRDRAWSSVALLGSLLVMSLAFVLPSQTLRALGVELVPFAIYWGYRTTWAWKALGAAMRQLNRPRGVSWQVEWALWTVWVVALIAGVVTLLADLDLGLDLVAVGVTGMFAFALWSAWVLISEVSE